MSDEDTLPDNFLDGDTFPLIDEVEDGFDDLKTASSAAADDFVRDPNDDDDEEDDEDIDNPLFDSFDDRDLL